MVLLIVFTASGQQTDVSMDCKTHYMLTSPNYPSYYPNDVSVEWYITAPSHRRILVTFHDFSLEDFHDTVVILDMVNAHNVKRYSGEKKQFPPFLTQGHGLRVKFTSSERGRRKGFNISVSCYETSGNVMTRLVDGTSPGEGFLELPSQSGEWMRVCEDSLPEADTVAEVICGELGYPGVKEITYVNEACASDHLNETCPRAPICQDNTYRLVDCEPTYSACSSNMVVKIKCHEPGYTGCYESETMQLQNGLPFISTTMCISSCKADDIQAVAIMNYVECFCTTFAEAQLEDASKCSEETEALSRMSVYSASVGFCDMLNDITGGSWDSNITWFGSIVHLTCLDGYSLNGSGTLQCVPGVTPYYPEWNGSILSCIMDVTTKSFMESTSLTTLDTDMTSDHTTIPETTFMTIITTDSTTPEEKWDEVTIAAVILAMIAVIGIISVSICCYKHRAKYHWKSRSEYGPGQTNDGQSTSSYNRRGADTSSRHPNSAPRSSTARHGNGPPGPNIGNFTTPTSVISPVLPNNVPQDIRPPVPPSSHPSNTSNIPLTLLLQYNPRSENHYISSSSYPNPHYYASSSDTPRVASTSLEEAYQEPSSMGMVNHSYEGTSDERGQSNATLQSENTLTMGLSMISRPLPHRPFSSNCNEGPTLPPRDTSLHSQTRTPVVTSLRQRKSKAVNENNNFPLGACASEYNVIQDLPNIHPHATSRKLVGQPAETPFHHTLGKDEQLRRSLGQDRNNLEAPTSKALQGDTPDPFYHRLENDAHGSDSENNNHLLYPATICPNSPDRTDMTDSTMMINNILYIPMTSCSK